ncbi:MAG TPA: Asd/ArgC dimerization domain-containing protein [Gaiellaceae bacterium]
MPRVAVVGATGAVGRVMVDLLLERGFDNVRAFASSRSAGAKVHGLPVDEATPDSLAGFDVCFFSVGSSASRELVPQAMQGGALCVDKSEAFRLQDGVPLVVPEVNGERALEHDGLIANPNCSTIPLTLVLKPLHEEAGLRSVRVATYQSASGKGAQRLQQLLDEPQGEHDLSVDWDYDGEEFDEEMKIREEARKILELPELPISATCVRVPVPVGHAESIWIETEEPLAPARARELLAAAPSVRFEEFPTPGKAAGGDEALVGRIRRDAAAENGLSLHLACDNLRKGAALNGIQIAELVLSRRTVAARR